MSARARARRAAQPAAVRTPVDLTTLADGAEVVDADVTGDVSDVSARRVTFDGCRLQGVRFTGADLAHARFVNCVLVDCDLSGVMADELELAQVELTDCRLDGIVVTRGELSDVRLAECRLRDAVLRMTSFQRVELEVCALTGVDLSGATFAATTFTRCDLSGAQFWHATMTGTSFAGSTIAGIRGGGALRGVQIDRAQILDLAPTVFEHLDIVVVGDDGLDVDTGDDGLDVDTGDETTEGGPVRRGQRGARPATARSASSVRRNVVHSSMGRAPRLR